MLKIGHLKKKTEEMVCAAQDQALRAKSIKVHIDGQDLSPMCRLCGESTETVRHLSSSCPALATSKYRIRHGILGKHIHWLVLRKFGFPTKTK